MATESPEMLANSVSQLEVAECPIAKLADEDLAAIFKHLPPFERLIVSEVCRKWRDVSRASWLDVTRLDLSQVATANIHAVIKKCPNLSSVSAMRQNLGDLFRFVGRLSNLTSLKCVDCTFTIDRVEHAIHPISVGELVRNAAAWQELIWHNSKTVITESNEPIFEFSLPYGNPHTLRRLQLSAVYMTEDELGYISDALHLPHMKSLILANFNLNFPRTVDYGYPSALFTRVLCQGLAVSKNLRELFIDSPHLRFIVEIMSAFPNLQILYLDNVDYAQINIACVIRRNCDFACSCGHRPILLSLIASRGLSVEGEALVPTRKLFPKGFDDPPIPKLHLFLGKIAAERLRFHSSPCDALEIHPIDAPLPEFLEKEKIKPIFEGSWIASRIKEGAKEGSNLADYSFEGNAPPISYVQE